MKKKKIEQINGKKEDFAPSTLDQVWGDNGLNKYKTLDEKEYMNSLSQMNGSDLQNHAQKIGVPKTDNTDLLKRHLLKEFRLFVGSYRQPRVTKGKPNELSKEALKILSEGR